MNGTWYLLNGEEKRDSQVLIEHGIQQENNKNSINFHATTRTITGPLQQDQRLTPAEVHIPNSSLRCVLFMSMIFAGTSRPRVEPVLTNDEDANKSCGSRIINTNGSCSIEQCHHVMGHEIIMQLPTEHMRHTSKDPGDGPAFCST